MSMKSVRSRDGQQWILDYLTKTAGMVQNFEDDKFELPKGVKNYKMIKDGKQGVLRVYLKYEGETKRQIISGLKVISRPGIRKYVRKTEIPLVLRGLGLTILSTSRGVITDREARKLNVGGELLCSIW